MSHYHLLNPNRVMTKVIKTVLVPASMYHTSTYTDIETSTFSIGSKIGHTDLVLHVSADFGCTGRYRNILFYWSTSTTSDTGLTPLVIIDNV